MKRMMFVGLLLAMAWNCNAQTVIIDSSITVLKGAAGKPDTFLLPGKTGDPHDWAMHEWIEDTTGTIPFPKLKGDVTVTENMREKWARDSLFFDVTKALELAVKYLPLKNERPDDVTAVTLEYRLPPTPAERKIAEAKRLEQEAKDLKQYDADIQFIREALKRWKTQTSTSK